MTTLNSTRLFAATLAIAAFGAFATGNADAAPQASDTSRAAGQAVHAERMKLIGRTARYDEQAAAPAVDTVPANAAARQQAYVDRAELAGRTVQFGDVAPAPVAADPAPRNVDEAVAAYKVRMTLIGRTVQQNELPARRGSARMLSDIAQPGSSGSQGS